MAYSVRMRAKDVTSKVFSPQQAKRSICIPGSQILVLTQLSKKCV